MEHITHLVTAYGYLIVFAVVFLDQAAVSIPSPPFVAAMGLLASNGRFNIYSALGVVLAGALLADSIWYLIGGSKRHVLHRLLRRKNWEHKHAKGLPLLRGGILGALLTVKFSLIPTALVPFFAGSTQLPRREFFFGAVISNLAWSAVFLAAGFTTGYGHSNFLLHSNQGLFVAASACCLLILAPTAFQWSLGRIGYRGRRRNDQAALTLPQQSVAVNSGAVPEQSDGVL